MKTVTTATTNEIDRDHEALERAFKIASRDPLRAAQLEDMARSGKAGWRYAAKLAAYNCQNRALGLKPWEEPPCHCDPHGDGVMNRLLRRMLDAGLSQFEPDPLKALKG